MAQPFAEFVGAPQSRVFCVRYAPDPIARHSHAVVFLQPFAEEMNRSRREFSKLGRLFCARGYETILLDYLGTGDSDAEFGDVEFADWLYSVEAVVRRFDACHLIAMRGGSLLVPWISMQMKKIGKPLGRCALVEPIIHGSEQLEELLRQRVLASRFSGRKESRESLVESIRECGNIVLGGYDFSSSLFQQLNESHFDIENLDSQVSLRVFVRDQSDIEKLRSLRNSGVDIEACRFEPMWALERDADSIHLCRSLLDFIVAD